MQKLQVETTIELLGRCLDLRGGIALWLVLVIKKGSWLVPRMLKARGN